MSYYRFVVFCAFAAFAAGCATPTPYQPADPYGFSEQQLEDDRFRVRFSGNALTDRDTVENYLLYRAAELTLARGYDYFLLADRSVDADTRYVYTFSAYPGYGYYHVYPHRRRGLLFGPGVETAWPVTRFDAVATVKLARGEPPAGRADAFDAAELRRYLEPLLRRPEPPPG